MPDKPQPTMGLTERREAERKIAAERSSSRRRFMHHKELAANADREYRKTRARVYLEAKSAGDTDQTAKMKGEEAAADHKHAADLNDALAKSALLRWEECERDSVSVRDIHQTSERIDGLGA